MQSLRELYTPWLQRMSFTLANLPKCSGPLTVGRCVLRDCNFCVDDTVRIASFFGVTSNTSVMRDTLMPRGSEGQQLFLIRGASMG